MKKETLFKLIVALALPQLAGLIGTLFTTPNIPTWYAGLAKPELAPPNWVFAPVWTTLFVLMGIAFFLVWNKADSRVRGDDRGRNGNDMLRKIAIGLFLFQLVLNTVWSVIFFGMQNPGAAFGEIMVLWLAIVATTLVFFKVSKFAGWLMVPYIAWVSFAAYLNFQIWQLNSLPLV